MRIRTLKPEFWSHPVISRQSDAAKLLAIGLLNYADDEGYFYADARMPCSQIGQVVASLGVGNLLSLIHI